MSLDGPSRPKRLYAKLRPWLAKALVLSVVVGAFVGGWLWWEVAGVGLVGVTLGLLLVGVGCGMRNLVVWRAGASLAIVMGPLLCWPMRSGGLPDVKLPVKVLVVDSQNGRPVAAAEVVLVDSLLARSERDPRERDRLVHAFLARLERDPRVRDRLKIPPCRTGPDGTAVLPVGCFCIESTKRRIWGATTTHRMLTFVEQLVALRAKGYEDASMLLPKEERERDDFAWFCDVAPMENVGPVEITVELHRHAAKGP